MSINLGMLKTKTSPKLEKISAILLKDPASIKCLTTDCLVTNHGEAEQPVLIQRALLFHSVSQLADERSVIHNHLSG